MSVRSLSPLCATVLCSAYVLGSAAAADVHVPGDAASIQAGIDMAQPGDRVIVAPGVWSETIDFLGKSITVKASAGADFTVIDGGGAPGFVVTIAGSSDAALVGFTVTGGFGQGGSSGVDGGGILLEGASASLEGLTIEGNHGVLGGGVSARTSIVALTNSVVQDNQSLQGGGVYAELGSLRIHATRFSGNEAVNFGGAVAVLGTAHAQIENTEFAGNTASGFGAALFANHAEIEVVSSSFVGNGRAEPLDDGVSWVVHTGGGGGIYTTSSSGRIASSRLLDNVAAFGSGLYVAGSGDLEIVNTLLAGNARQCNCGTAALYANSSSPRVVNSTIADNGGMASVFTTYNSFPEVVNSVLVGNTVATAGNGETDLSWSAIDSVATAAAVGPGVLLVADALLDAESDYAPLPGSPLIDAGNNLRVPEDAVSDLAGQPRFVDDPDTVDSGLGDAPLVDLGAIEFQVADGTAGHEHIFGDSFQGL